MTDPFINFEIPPKLFYCNNMLHLTEDTIPFMLQTFISNAAIVCLMGRKNTNLSYISRNCQLNLMPPSMLFKRYLFHITV